jgi:DNA-directed RNA polymerase subunit beta
MTERKSYSSNKFHLELPYLLEVQKASYDQFLQSGVTPRERQKVGLERVFQDIFPISDMKELFTLKYEGYSFGIPKYSIKECRERGLTFSMPLKARLKLQVKEEDGEEKKLKEEIENEVFICDLPVMTENGTFIINGAERVVVSQLHRSPGVSFDEELLPNGKSVFKSRIIPHRGSWVEFNTDNDTLYLLIDRKKKIPASILLRCIGYETNESILELFYEPETARFDADSINTFYGRVLFSDVIDTDSGEVIAEANAVLDAKLCDRILEGGIREFTLIKGNVEDDILMHNTLSIDATSNIEEALKRIYQVTHQQQEEAPNYQTALQYFNNLFYFPSRYDLGEVGRYRLSSKLYRQRISDYVRNYEENRKEEFAAGLEKFKSENDMIIRNYMRDAFSVFSDDATKYSEAAKDLFVKSCWIAFPRISNSTMSKTDFLSIIYYMVGLYNNHEGYSLDDIDHLGNRRARSVGELLANQLSVGLTRMSRAIREHLSLRENEGMTPVDLVNARTVNSVVATFFGSSQLSQFMDQANPLSELTHKRRLSALGPGGLSRERAGFEVRDVHHTHYGRLCPIETPEGPNIGLINSMATFSIVNHFGFIETPYRIVGLLEFKDAAGKVCQFPEDKWHFGLFKGFTREPHLFIKEELNEREMNLVRRHLDNCQRKLFDSYCNKVFEYKTAEGRSQFLRNGNVLENFKGTPDYRQVGVKVQVLVSDYITYLTADEEDKYRVAPASTKIDDNNRFVDPFVLVRAQGEFPNLPKVDELEISDTETQRVDLMDVAPMQIVSIAAGLIPFLEHDDANRALMGSNMQRQAVPLLRSEAPVVGTGLERRAALDSGTVIRAKYNGTVTFVDANRVEVLRDETQGADYEFLGMPEHDQYELRKFERSNQDTCINQKPVVDVGMHVQAGDVLADGASTEQGELALGKNILIGFLPWNGYNYEDAIIISEELAIKDTFTSIHIEEFEMEVRDTKRGPEELTKEIPNVSEEALRNLDEVGIVRVGAEVRAGDILVGKVTPKGETELSPEERLLRAIFGEKAGDVRDSSLRAPSGMKGVVVETRVFSRKERDKKSKNEDQVKIAKVKEEFSEKIANITRARNTRLSELLVGQTCGEVKDASTHEVLVAAGKKWTQQMLNSVNFMEVSLQSALSKEENVQTNVVKVLEVANQRILELTHTMEKEIDKVTKGDELKPGVLQMVKVYVAKKRRLSIGDKMAGRHGNKGVISKVVPVEDMPFTEDGRTLQILLNPLGVPSRMNVGQVLEVHLGWAAKTLGFKVATPVFDGATFSQIEKELKDAFTEKPIVKVNEASWTSDEKKAFEAQNGHAIPAGGITGKARLYDGRTGEAFLNDVTIGYMYMLKLGHLVEDKIHARSIGPYSLVTQQPLGGKSQFGGQRFGEMEVWALEAYGAAYTLQELLTVKSDDVMGRSKIYEAIVKGINTPAPGIPESFRVLIREIRSLGLDIKTSGDK